MYVFEINLTHQYNKTGKVIFSSHTFQGHSSAYAFQKHLNNSGVIFLKFMINRYILFNSKTICSGLREIIYSYVLCIKFQSGFAVKGDTLTMVTIAPFGFQSVGDTAQRPLVWFCRGSTDELS